MRALIGFLGIILQYLRKQYVYRQKYVLKGFSDN